MFDLEATGVGRGETHFVLIEFGSVSENPRGKLAFSAGKKKFAEDEFRWDAK